MKNSTNQAPLVWEPKKRDERPSFLGSCRNRRIAKITMPIVTRTTNRSCEKRMIGHSPINGKAKPAMNSSTKASSTVIPSTIKPAKTSTWAMPGTVHFSSFRCPRTSVNSAWSRRPFWSVRSTVGWPDRMRLLRNSTRRTAKNPATRMMTMPTPARSAIDGSIPSLQLGPMWAATGSRLPVGTPAASRTADPAL